MDCQDVFDEDVDELTLISHEFNNIASSRKKEGYKEGMERGQQVHMQEGFDQGFKQGFACTVLMSKVKGILNGVLEFYRLYDGNPINDHIALEAQLCIDSIDQLETDHVIDDLLDLQVSNKPPSGGCGGKCSCGKNNDDEDEDEEGMDLDLMQLNDEESQNRDSRRNKPTVRNRRGGIVDPRQIEKRIEEDQQVGAILQQCRQVLNKLGWNDELSNLLSTATD